MSDIKKFPSVRVDEYSSRQVLSESPELMVVAFNFTKDGEGALHSHPHVQSTYVESGKFEFSVNGNKMTVEAGDSFVIPSNAEHGCVCLESGRLIDTFTPRRDDFL